MVAIVVAADAIFVRARIRLRTCAAHHSRRLSRGFGPEGWRSADSVGHVFGRDADEVGAIEDDSSGSRFDFLLSSNGRGRR
jgi:hypothetical protein